MSKLYMGVEIGGTKQQILVVDEGGNIYGRSTRKTNAPRSYQEIFADMAECARDAAKEAESALML